MCVIIIYLAFSITNQFNLSRTWPHNEWWISCRFSFDILAMCWQVFSLNLVVLWKRICFDDEMILWHFLSVHVTFHFFIVQFYFSTLSWWFLLWLNIFFTIRTFLKTCQCIQIISVKTFPVKLNQIIYAVFSSSKSELYISTQNYISTLRSHNRVLIPAHLLVVAH